MKKKCSFINMIIQIYKKKGINAYFTGKITIIINVLINI